MQTINKTTVLDKCISGNLKKYKTLINPMYDQFNIFYDAYKSIFMDDALESSVDRIVFNSNAKDNIARFNISCSNIKNVNVNDFHNSRVTIVKTDELVCINIQPNK